MFINFIFLSVFAIYFCEHLCNLAFVCFIDWLLLYLWGLLDGRIYYVWQTFFLMYPLNGEDAK